MDEQIQEQTQESSLEADFQEDNQIENIPEDEPVSEPEEGEEPEISIKDGEVKFSDDFFGDVPDDKPSGKDIEVKQEEKPNYYTDEELQNTPASQWDKSRMPDDVKRYYEAFLNQQAAIERQKEMQQIAQTPPSFLTQPKQYTPKELHEESKKLALERLGLKDADDFDEYDGEHRAALDMARMELLQKNANETADYQRKAGEYKNWRMFSGQLAAQPDFNEFHQWYLGEVRKNGNTPEQIDAGLKNLADMQGFGAVQQVWSEFYRQFKSSEFSRQFKSSKTQVQNKPVQRTRAKTPPTLESTRGGNVVKGRIYNMRDFGKLDEDAQVQALIDMGIV